MPGSEFLATILYKWWGHAQVLEHHMCAKHFAQTLWSPSENQPSALASHRGPHCVPLLQKLLHSFTLAVCLTHKMCSVWGHAIHLVSFMNLVPYLKLSRTNLMCPESIQWLFIELLQKWSHPCLQTLWCNCSYPFLIHTPLGEPDESHASLQQKNATTNKILHSSWWFMDSGFRV